MKVIEQPAKFVPVTIVLETPEELSLVNAVFAALTASRKATVSKVAVTPALRTKATAHPGNRPHQRPAYYIAVKSIIQPMLNEKKSKGAIAKELNARGLRTATNLVWNDGRVNNFVSNYKMQATA